MFDSLTGSLRGGRPRLYRQGDAYIHMAGIICIPAPHSLLVYLQLGLHLFDLNGVLLITSWAAI